MGFILLWLIERTWSVAWAVLTVLAAGLLRVPVAQVRLGSGPALHVGQIGGIEVLLGAVQLGGSVHLVDGAPMPVAVGAGPALILGSTAGALAPVGMARAVLSFVVPALAFLTPEPPGLLRALSRAAELALVDPVGMALALFGTLGVLSALLGALAQLTRFGPPGVAAFLAAQGWVLICVLRAAALDFTG